MRKLLGVLILLTAVAPAAAQGPVMPAVGFDEAVQRAVAKNPTVAQAEANIARAEAILQQARAVLGPTVSARTTNATNNISQRFGENVVQPRSQVTFAGNATMPLLAFGDRARAAQAGDQIEVAAQATAATRQQVAVAAGRAYLAVIAAQRQVDVEMRALDNTRAHLDFADRRLAGGVGSRLNMLRAAQAVAAAEARVEDTRLQLRQAQEALGVLLAENGPVDAAAEPALDVQGPGDEPAWMTARPDVRLQRSLIFAQERTVRDSWKTDASPTAFVSFDPQLITPSGVFQQSRSWRLTVSVTQPIFQNGLPAAQRRQREVTLEAARLALSEIEIRARGEVRMAQASLDNRERALVSLRRAAEQAGEVLRITTIAFEAGATTNIETIDAQRSARDAETAAVLAQDAARRARLDLLAATGKFPR